jgi:hypothetical protein
VAFPLSGTSPRRKGSGSTGSRKGPRNQSLLADRVPAGQQGAFSRNCVPVKQLNVPSLDLSGGGARGCYLSSARRVFSQMGPQNGTR